MRLWSLWAISRWEEATTANYNNQQTKIMNVHELLDLFIVATGTLAVLPQRQSWSLSESERKQREQRANIAKKSPGLKQELAGFMKGGRSRITTMRGFAGSCTS